MRGIPRSIHYHWKLWANPRPHWEQCAPSVHAGNCATRPAVPTIAMGAKAKNQALDPDGIDLDSLDFSGMGFDDLDFSILDGGEALDQ